MEYQNPQSNFKALLSSTLQSNRPHLTPSSIKTYTSVLFNLHKHMGGNRNNIDWCSMKRSLNRKFNRTNV